MAAPRSISWLLLFGVVVLLATLCASDAEWEVLGEDLPQRARKAGL